VADATRQLRRLHPVPTGNALQTHSACTFTLAVGSAIFLRHDARRLWECFILELEHKVRIAKDAILTINRLRQQGCGSAAILSHGCAVG
jgi:hypothetical protein